MKISPEVVEAVSAKTGTIQDKLSTMGNLHSALKTTVVSSHNEGGINYILVRLQNGKDDFVETLHARPNTFSTSGFQTTDFLSLLGFSRSGCAFHQSECFCRQVPEGLDIKGLSADIGKSFQIFQNAVSHLENCGLFIEQPEGWGFFYGKPAARRTHPIRQCRGDGHTSPKTEKMKESEDEFFHFVFTWIEGGSDKGWTTHYRAKHMPLSSEFQLVMGFLGGFNWFADCPEYDFEGCWWRFLPYEKRGNDVFGSNAETAHRWFDGHAAHFAAGIRGLLEAHAVLEPWGLTFLPEKKISAPLTSTQKITTSTSNAATALQPMRSGYQYDVAFSFAGTERSLAEKIATLVKEKGFSVFYDNFYPEQLWGKDLVATFDRIYRKESRYCVMFLSQEYADRMWTTHERKSATARALQERGNAYILPVKVEDIDIDGLTPTTGYVSLSESSPEQIAELLISMLKT